MKKNKITFKIIGLATLFIFFLIENIALCQGLPGNTTETLTTPTLVINTENKELVSDIEAEAEKAANKSLHSPCYPKTVGIIKTEIEWNGSLVNKENNSYVIRMRVY